MADNFASHSTGLDSPATRHFAITPSDDADLDPRPRALYCRAAGDVVIRDAAGVDLTYTLDAGDVLPFRGVRVLATGTTATLYGWE